MRGGNARQPRKSMAHHSPDSSSVAERRRAFRRMHEHGCFVIPNPWDVGSARVLVQLGFPALATTSAGFAWSHGRAGQPRDARGRARAPAAVAWQASTCRSTQISRAGLPLSPTEWRGTSALAAETGIAGAVDRGLDRRRVEPALRIRAGGRAHPRGAPGDRRVAAPDVVLTGRSEGFIVGRPDLAETIRRLTAYAEAGADCLYAPGLRSLGRHRAVVKAVAPKPVNVLASAATSRPWRRLPRLACGGSASAARWRARPGRGFSPPLRRSRRTARSARYARRSAAPISTRGSDRWLGVIVCGSRFARSRGDAPLRLDEGDRYAFLTATRDEIADATSLSFAYRFPDPTEANWYVLVIGDEGQIPNSAFTLTSAPARP